MRAWSNSFRRLLVEHVGLCSHTKTGDNNEGGRDEHRPVLVEVRGVETHRKDCLEADKRISLDLRVGHTKVEMSCKDAASSEAGGSEDTVKGGEWEMTARWFLS